MSHRTRSQHAPRYVSSWPAPYHIIFQGNRNLLFKLSPGSIAEGCDVKVGYGHQLDDIERVGDAEHGLEMASLL